MSGFKTLKLVTFLYANDENTEKDNRKPMPFIVVSETTLNKSNLAVTELYNKKVKRLKMEIET